MTKTFKTQISVTLIALSFAAATAPASAQGNLPARAVSALGTVIADQGNAALVQIREEFKDTLVERIKPYLPKPEAAAKSAPADDRKN